MPFTRVLTAWLAIVFTIRATDGVHDILLVPLLGAGAAQVAGNVLAIAAVLAVTQPLFKVYAGQYTGALVWYGLVLASLTVLFETLYARYINHLFGYEILARYDLSSGQLWPLVVITIALTPLVWAGRPQS